MLRSQKAVEIKELMSLLIMKTSNTEYNVNIIPTLLATGCQQAYAGAKFYDCNIAVVMTNSTFTEPAKRTLLKNWVYNYGKKSIFQTATEAYIKLFDL